MTATGDAPPASAAADGKKRTVSIERHRSIVDVHLLLYRSGRVLMLRRANASYGDGQLCFPSGHLESGESVVEGVIREAREEIGVEVDATSVRFLHVLHLGAPDGQDRVGFFFTTEHWRREPFNAEPHKCSELVRVDPGDLPDDVVPYQAAGLAGSLGPDSFSAHSWPSRPEHGKLTLELEPTGISTSHRG